MLEDMGKVFGHEILTIFPNMMPRMMLALFYATRQSISSFFRYIPSFIKPQWSTSLKFATQRMQWQYYSVLATTKELCSFEKKVHSKLVTNMAACTKRLWRGRNET